MRGAPARGDRLSSGRGDGDRMHKYRHQVAVVAADRYKRLWPAGPAPRARDAVHHRALLGGGQVSADARQVPALDITVLP